MRGRTAPAGTSLPERSLLLRCATGGDASFWAGAFPVFDPTTMTRRFTCVGSADAFSSRFAGGRDRAVAGSERAGAGLVLEGISGFDIAEGSRGSAG